MEDFGDHIQVNKCIVVNKTVQHLLHDILKSVKEEITHLTNQECPPPNDDTIAKYKRKEFNLREVRGIALKSYLHSELVAIITGVAKRALQNRIEQLERQRESLLSSRTRQSVGPKAEPDVKVFTSRETLSALSETMELCTQLRSMPTTPSKWLITALIKSHVMERATGNRYPNNGDRKNLWEKRIFNRYYGAKFLREYTVKTWLGLLSDAEQLLTAVDWADIVNNVLDGSVSDVNLRLYWHHRINPRVNLSEWTDEEDERLAEIVSRIGEHGRWPNVANELDTGRPAFACLQRWQRKLNRNFRPYRQWSANEDLTLLDTVKKLLELYPPSLIDWDVVAAHQTTRTARECEVRAATVVPAFSRSNQSGECRNVDGKKRNTTVSVSRKPVSQGRYLRPFSPSEDLQLLMGVQRRGIAGGRSGTGSGLGTGSWAVISIALPGRSIKACQQRYTELCEQFQPWTFAECRKLFELRMKAEGDEGTSQLTSFYRITTYAPLIVQFPGRSFHALREQFLHLLRWYRFWAALRRGLTSLSSLSGSDVVPHSLHNVNPPEGTKEDLKAILLAAPFTADFIAQISRLGVPKAEEEAFRLLIYWQAPESERATLSSKPVGTEFLLLLRDLESGELLPTASIIDHLDSASNDGQPSESAIVPALPDRSKVDSAWTLTQANRMLAFTTMKHTLAGSVRNYLLQIVHTGDYPVLRRRLEESLTDTPEPQSNVTDDHPALSSRGRAKFATQLLNDDVQFWSTLDTVLQLPQMRDVYKLLDKVSYFRVIAPVIARLMTRAGIDVPLKPKRRPRRKKTDFRPRRITRKVASSSASPFNVKTTTQENTKLTLRRNKLLQIKGLLHMYGRSRFVPTSAYSLNYIALSQNHSAGKNTPTELGMRHLTPILFHEVPLDLGRELVSDPSLLAPHCTKAARACIHAGLSLHDSTMASNQTTAPIDDLQSPSTSSSTAVTVTPQLPTTSSDSAIHVFPPCYATFLALKSLLVNLPTVLFRGVTRWSHLDEARQKYLEMDTSNRPEQNAEQAGHRNRLVELSNILKSPEYKRFMLTGLSLLLWPTLLCEIPASHFITAAKRSWDEAFAQIPKEIRDYRAKRNYKKMHLRLQSDVEDSDDDVLTDVLQEPPISMTTVEKRTKRPRGTVRPLPVVRQRGQLSRVRRFHFTKMLRSSTVRFRITNSDTDNHQLTVTLPASVKLLHASGFRPTSILKLHK